MKSLFPDHIDLTARVMDFQIQRQNIVSGNLANINTPGYKARTLEFEKDLQAALGISQNGPVSRTHPKHLPAKFSPDSTKAVPNGNPGVLCEILDQTALYPTLERDKKGSIKWKCICDCGNEHFVTEDALVNGNVQSCGCKKMEAQAEVYKNLSLHDGTSCTILKFSKNPRVDNRSGYRGIGLRSNGKYRAHIGFRGKHYNLGTFDSLQKALEERRYAEEILHEGFCDAFERWKALSHDDKKWEKMNPLIYDVRFKDGEFYITCNIEDLEKSGLRKSKKIKRDDSVKS